MPSSPLSSASGSEFVPDVPPPPKRRGRKPNPISRSARDALRKSNHSLIEKRRREKINDALASLRELVPREEEEDPSAAASAQAKKEKDREFKLEVLVRTVSYLEKLVVKVKELEGGVCKGCGGSMASDDAKTKTDKCASVITGKRSLEGHERETWEDHGDDGDDEEGIMSCDEDVEQASSPSIAPPPSSVRLPPISAILSPQFQLQLPTPPVSTQSRAMPMTMLPPALTLPSPPPFPHPAPRSRVPYSPSTHGSYVASLEARHPPEPVDLGAPAQDEETETAASLLLQISAKKSPTTPSFQRPKRVDGGAETPGSLLGIDRSRKRARLETM